MHVRRAIREAVKDVLVNANIVASDHVFTNRVTNLQANELPAIVIETPSDAISRGAGGPVAPRNQTRDVSVNVLIVVRGGKTIDDDLDDLAELVEPAMHGNPTLGLGAKDLELRGTASQTIGDGSELQGVLRLSYGVVVGTKEGSPKSIFAPAQ